MNTISRHILPWTFPAYQMCIRDSGESVTLSAPLTLSALGTHTLKLDSYTKTVNVTFRKATYAYSNLRLQLGLSLIHICGSSAHRRCGDVLAGDPAGCCRRRHCCGPAPSAQEGA